MSTPETAPEGAAETARRVTYRKVPVVLPEHTMQAIYEVFLDGALVGRVTRRRETVRTRFRGSRIGKDSTGTHWRHQTQEPDTSTWRDGPRWTHSRDHAALGLLREEHDMAFDEAREALGKPRTWA